MSTNLVLRSLAAERNYSPRRPMETDIVPMDDYGMQINRAVGAGAVTHMFDNNPFASSFDYVQYDDTSYAEYEKLADRKVQRGHINNIKKIAAKSNPHMKAAMTDFQDYVAGGWGFKPNKSRVIDRFLDTMEDEFDGLDSYFGDITDSLFMYSAFFHETVYDDEKQMRRWIANDVLSAEFKQDKTHPLGDRYVLGQRKSGVYGPVHGPKGWINLQDDPTVFYRRLYSRANYPYGVPFVDAGIFHMVMMVEFFKAYKSLLDSFVLPNLFFRVNRETIAEHVERDPSKRKGFVMSVFSMLLEQVKKLGPGRVVTMGSEVEEPTILSGMNKDSMGTAEGLINALDNQLELAFKTHGLTTLRNDSALNDTKAKYRMANYARVIKRGQRIITTPLNRQIRRAHSEVGSSDMSELYLERNIYEDEQILAEISSTITQAKADGLNAIDVLMETLDKAVEKGYMTEQQAKQKFVVELAKIEEQMNLVHPLD